MVLVGDTMSNPIKYRTCVEMCVEFVDHYCSFNSITPLLKTEEDRAEFADQMYKWFGRHVVQKPVDIDALKWGRGNLRAMKDRAVIQLMKDLAIEVEERFRDIENDAYIEGYDNA